MFPRVVIDTNVFISAVLFGGTAEKIRTLWQNKKIIFLISKEITEEYIRVLSYPKFNLTKAEINYILEEELFPFVEPINVTTKVNLVKEDNEDNKFIALAVDGKAKYIISGDKHLLNLCKHKDIKIVTIGDFLGNI
ncbi:putative toxin-antitoxin system toxin component, PIN family [bacterium]|nr:putative toxin-antitoxin system toxin component, PIN family [bacterium]